MPPPRWAAARPEAAACGITVQLPLRPCWPRLLRLHCCCNVLPDRLFVTLLDLEKPQLRMPSA